MQQLVDKISTNLNQENSFEKDLFQALLNPIHKTDDALRFTTFAAAFRELTRHVFHRLAPDKKVLACEWYENQTDKANGITRAQRMLYAIKGGLNDEFIENELDYDLKPILQKVSKVISQLNKYTHINPPTFNIDQVTGLKLVHDSLEAFEEFFATINSFRQDILSQYEKRLDRVITDTVVHTTIDDLDILATHYWIDGVYVNEIVVQNLDSNDISILIRGSIDVEHQFGSHRDNERGDGVQYEESYPYTIEVTANVGDPFNITIELEDILIDTSSHYE